MDRVADAPWSRFDNWSFRQTIERNACLNFAACDATVIMGGRRLFSMDDEVTETLQNQVTIRNESSISVNIRNSNSDPINLFFGSWN